MKPDWKLPAKLRTPESGGMIHRRHKVLQFNNKTGTECLPVFLRLFASWFIGFYQKTEVSSLIVEDLANKAGKQAPAAQIFRNLITLDKRFTKSSFYRLFAESRYFAKEGDVRIAVKLRE